MPAWDWTRLYIANHLKEADMPYGQISMFYYAYICLPKYHFHFLLMAE